jgi:hypothetical protein
MSTAPGNPEMEYTPEPKKAPITDQPIYDPHKKTLIVERDEWKSTTGVHLQLCAIHEMKAGGDITKQAITVLGGIAVCREHFSHMITDLRLGKPTTAIIIEALAGEY